MSRQCIKKLELLLWSIALVVVHFKVKEEKMVAVAGVPLLNDSCITACWVSEQKTEAWREVAEIGLSSVSWLNLLFIFMYDNEIAKQR